MITLRISEKVIFEYMIKSSDYIVELLQLPTRNEFLAEVKKEKIKNSFWYLKMIATLIKN